MSTDPLTKTVSDDTTMRDTRRGETNQTLHSSQMDVPRRAGFVITVPDPDAMEPEVWANVGGTVQWRTETHFYPHFEVHFLGMDPCGGENSCFKGSDVAPVVIRLQFEGEYEYEIWQGKKPNSISVKHRPHRFKVRSCTVCQP